MGAWGRLVTCPKQARAPALQLISTITETPLSSLSDPYDSMCHTNYEGKLIMQIWKLLAEWGITNPTEEDIWDAIAELDGHKLDYYGDGDLTEWL